MFAVLMQCSIFLPLLMLVNRAQSIVRDPLLDFWREGKPCASRDGYNCTFPFSSFSGEEFFGCTNDSSHKFGNYLCVNGNRSPICSEECPKASPKILFKSLEVLPSQQAAAIDLRCMAVGSPNPELIWRRYSNYTQELQRTTSGQREPRIIQSILTVLDQPQDYDDYYCDAVSNNKIMHSQYLKVDAQLFQAHSSERTSTSKLDNLPESRGLNEEKRNKTSVSPLTCPSTVPCEDLHSRSHDTSEEEPVPCKTSLEDHRRETKDDSDSVTTIVIISLLGLVGWVVAIMIFVRMRKVLREQVYTDGGDIARFQTNMDPTSIVLGGGVNRTKSFDIDLGLGREELERSQNNLIPEDGELSPHHRIRDEHSD